LKSEVSVQKEDLKELFNRRLRELNIAPTNVLDILQISYRTLNGILNGTQKTVDFTNLIKIADFLQLPKEQIVQLYVSSLEKNFAEQVSTTSDKISFIKQNFDLVVLKKAGFIKSIRDYEDIEKKSVSSSAYVSIFDYKRPPVDVAFSAGRVKPKNEINRTTWIRIAEDIFKELNNPYQYNQQALVDYFPLIRRHSTNVQFGLLNVFKELFKIGVTVIYLPPLPSLHLRGATFSLNNRPCVVITDYRGFYPTLWFALIHELFHVIFDWEEIKNNSYHISDPQNEIVSVQEKELEANNFAREYLFSNKKMDALRPHLSDSKYVNEFALNNQIHPSFVYVFNAYDRREESAWRKAQKNNEDISSLVQPFDLNWADPRPITEYASSIKYKFYS
jgi:hypothetical protein